MRLDWRLRIVRNCVLSAFSRSAAAEAERRGREGQGWVCGKGGGVSEGDVLTKGQERHGYVRACATACDGG